MPDQRTLPLQTVRPKEVDEDLRPYLTSGSALLGFLQKHQVVDAGEIISASSVIVQGTEPVASDRGKLWVNQSSQFVAVWDGGKWVKLYLHGYPKLMPFKYAGKTVPSFLRLVSSGQQTKEGLAQPDTAETPWVIFDPDNESIL